VTVCQDSPTKLRARGRVLVLADVRELVEQNHAKYRAYGLEADIFSAGLGRKQAARQVVFGSVQSVVRNLEAFAGGPADDASYRRAIERLRQAPHAGRCQRRAL